MCWITALGSWARCVLSSGQFAHERQVCNFSQPLPEGLPLFRDLFKQVRAGVKRLGKGRTKVDGDSSSICRLLTRLLLTNAVVRATLEAVYAGAASGECYAGARSNAASQTNMAPAANPPIAMRAENTAERARECIALAGVISFFVDFQGSRPFRAPSDGQNLAPGQ
jgi:hypothetical protein